MCIRDSLKTGCFPRKIFDMYIVHILILKPVYQFTIDDLTGKCSSCNKKPSKSRRLSLFWTICLRIQFLQIVDIVVQWSIVTSLVQTYITKVNVTFCLFLIPRLFLMLINGVTTTYFYNVFQTHRSQIRYKLFEKTSTKCQAI